MLTCVCLPIHACGVFWHRCMHAYIQVPPDPLPAILHPHHFLVAFRRDRDQALAAVLEAEDFRAHRVSPGRPVVEPHTPGLPSGVAYDSFQPL